jgi:Lrp/AsnC family leucine-responsive transcriptional regulator
MNNGKPDELDLRILMLLQENARLQNTTLGSMVGLTISPVTNRIEKLENAGIIKRYMVILDRVKIGQPVLVILMVKLKEQNTDRMLEFEQMISVMPQVQSCLTVSGNWNFILQVTADSPQAYAIWLMDKVNIHSNVGNVESAFLMREGKNYGAFKL